MKNNVMPAGYNPSEYECKDFLPPKHVQDFPIRGKAVILRISRRRRRNKINKKKRCKTAKSEIGAVILLEFENSSQYFD